jgi:hypothetical protein
MSNNNDRPQKRVMGCGWEKQGTFSSFSPLFVCSVLFFFFVFLSVEENGQLRMNTCTKMTISSPSLSFWVVLALTNKKKNNNANKRDQRYHDDNDNGIESTLPIREETKFMLLLLPGSWVLSTVFLFFFQKSHS